MKIGLRFFPFILLGLVTRPVYAGTEADLVELGKDGQPSPSARKTHLALNETDGQAVSLTLTETVGSPCPPGAMCIMMVPLAKVRVFKIVHASADRCGTTRYLARAGRATLDLIDHTARRCDDFRPYQWEVVLRDYGQRARKLYGNPPPEKPTPVCSDILRNAACTMVYMPSTCQVSSVDGVKLPQPVSSSGGNACVATLGLKVALCEQGLDWEKADDLRCMPDSILSCPAILCVAPPKGCVYQPDATQRDERGCSVGCGTLKCGGVSGPGLEVP